MKVRGLDMESLFFEAVEHDPVAQVCASNGCGSRAARVRLSPLVMRYARPPELDLMARAGGTAAARPLGRLARRARSRRTAAMHVSVWQR